MKISIVIRTLNEKESLNDLLLALKEQDYKGEKEIIVVDNESTDGTPELAKQFGAKIVTIKKNEFSYPKSMNAGCAAATGELIVLTVGHALPINNNWLTLGVKDFKDEKVAGIYAPTLPGKKSSFIEKIAYSFNYQVAKLRGIREVKRFEIGILGATNCVIKKNLWQAHNFDESYGLGGEDGEWAVWAINNGYKILCDYNFSLQHSHGLGFFAFIKANQYWRRLTRPSTFDKKALNFRKDIKFE